MQGPSQGPRRWVLAYLEVKNHGTLAHLNSPRAAARKFPVRVDPVETKVAPPKNATPAKLCAKAGASCTVPYRIHETKVTDPVNLAGKGHCLTGPNDPQRDPVLR